MKALAILLAIDCAGCVQEEPTSSPNQCLRAELFKQCMAALPAGPTSTKYNDWDDVVDSCDNVARYQSIRLNEQIPKECRS